ncbi:MAG: tetratricopeptide repeat protein [Myxococcota bacterium]
MTAATRGPRPAPRGRLAVALAVALGLMVLEGAPGGGSSGGGSSAAVGVARAAERDGDGGGDQKKAAEHFRRGKELYDEGDYDAALVEFKRAYETSPNYRVLFNIGQVQYQIGDYASARDTFTRYLDEAGNRIDANRRDTVRRDIQKLSARVALVRVTVNEPGATVTVDDVARGDAPFDAPLSVSAGRRKISATKEGYSSDEAFVEVAGGDEIDVALRLRELAPGGGTGDGRAPDPTATVGQGSDDDEGGLIDAPWEAWTITAGLGTGALVFGLLALSANSQLETELEAPADPNDVDAIRTRMIAFSVVTDVLIAGTAVAGGIALYLTIVSENERADQSAAGNRRDPGLEVSVGVGPGALLLRGRF